MKATVDAKEFSQALNKVIKVIKQASIPELEGVLVSISNLTRSIGSACVRFSDGKLSMLTPSGGYCTQIQIDGESSIDFGFELRYMIDALRQFRGEPQVKLKVINPVAPIILEAEGRSDFAMVLPVRMKQAAAA